MNVPKKSSYFDEFVDPVSHAKNNFPMRAEHYARYIFAKEYLLGQKDHQVIYDIACGNGYGSKILSKAGSVIGFDKSKELLIYANKINQSKNIHYVNINLDEDNLESSIERYDIPRPTAIICFETLEHIDNPEQLLGVFKKTLSLNDILILSTPNAKFEPKKKGKSRNQFHKHLFWKEDLVKIIEENGFVIEQFLGQPFTNLLIHKAKPSIKFLDISSQSSSLIFKLLSRMVAYPTHALRNYSYSFIIVARRKM